MEQTKNIVFEPLGEGFYKKGNRIYLRVQKNGRSTWLSTKTDKLPLARKWKENWQRQQWLQESGVAPKKPTGGEAATLFVDQLLDEYVLAGHPTVRKGALKRKAARSIINEAYCLRPLRVYFGRKNANQVALGDCDQYHKWRTSGGYVARFKVRGNDVTRQTRGGDRAVDLELVVLSNALSLATRRGLLQANPLQARGQYTDDSTIRHCREAAPTPQSLVLITRWMIGHAHQQDADIIRFVAYTGLRIGEALKSHWDDVDWEEALLHVERSKRGVFPFVLLLPELKTLLHEMKRRAKAKLIFPSPLDLSRPRDASSFRRRLAQACKELGLPHVIPHGLRSYFVTQARQSGLSDAEIAELIGDKTGPVLIAQVYGDVRPDHLLLIARKIRLTAKTRTADKPTGQAARNRSSE